MRPISSVFKRRKQRVDKSNTNFSELMPITIHFDGSIEPRNVSDDYDYVMDLFYDKPGDIVVSKIDLKNGAVAIIPDGWNNAVVTNHFMVYQPNLDVINPQYFLQIIQANFFKNYLWRNKVGAEGRKEVKIDFLESVHIPAPQISVQNKICNYWNEGKGRLDAQFEARKRLLNSLESDLLKATTNFEGVGHSKAFSTTYSGAKQWDVKAGRAAAFIAANKGFVRLGDFTEECTETVRPWETPDAEWPVYGVNNKEGVFLNSLQRGADFNAPYKRIEKDWFFHNPTRANVGSFGIVPEVPVDAITSPEYQVWRLKGGFLPAFVSLIIRTDYFLSLVAFNRMGGVKQRMYYANLADIRLPMVLLEEQQRIADEYTAIQAELLLAKADLELRKGDIEKMILGTMKIEGA
jgi:restriction endonuclease S subunit